MKDEAFDLAIILFSKIENRFNHSDRYCIGELGLYEQVRVDCMQNPHCKSILMGFMYFFDLLPVSKSRQIPPRREKWRIQSLNRNGNGKYWYKFEWDRHWWQNNINNTSFNGINHYQNRSNKIIIETNKRSTKITIRTSLHSINHNHNDNRWSNMYYFSYFWHHFAYCSKSSKPYSNTFQLAYICFWFT